MAFFVYGLKGSPFSGFTGTGVVGIVGGGGGGFTSGNGRGGGGTAGMWADLDFPMTSSVVLIFCQTVFGM